MNKITVFVLGLCFVLSSVLAAETADMRSISVSGEGEITVDADQLSFYIRIETKEEQLDNAKAVNDRKLEKAEEILQLFSVPNSQIDISGYRVYPRYETSIWSSPIKIEGFVVSRRITIRLEDVSQYDALVDALIAAEIYDIRGVQYSLTNSAEMHAEARENALGKARQKAEQMAGVYGNKLGKVISIDERSPRYRYSSFGSSSAASNVAVTDMTSSDAEEIMGKLVFRAAVDVVFELKE
jgi:uncharacterized protein YggE